MSTPTSATRVYDAEGWDIEDVETYHGGDIDDEYAALMSLALDRRLRSGGLTRHLMSGGDPAGSPFYARHQPPQLAAPVRGRSLLPAISTEVDLSGASELMNVYARASGDDAVAAVRAATQYADALWWADLDPRISWIKLVGALEIAAKHWAEAKGLTRVEHFKRYLGGVYKKFKDTHGEAIADAVAAEWDPNAGATARFVDFTVAHAPDPPLLRPAHSQVEWPKLRNALRIIYEWRSRDLHAGVPFPGPMCEPPYPPDDNGVPPERFSALAASQRGGHWPAERMPMFLHTFAFVARQALINWWRALPDAGLADPPDA